MILTNSLVRLWSLLSASMASLVTVAMICSIMVASMEKNLWRPKTLTDMCAAGGMATLFSTLRNIPDVVLVGIVLRLVLSGHHGVVGLVSLVEEVLGALDVHGRFDIFHPV